MKLSKMVFGAIAGVGLFLFISFPLAHATDIVSNLTVDNYFDLYVSVDDNTQGIYIGSGDSWGTGYTFTKSLTPGKTNYLHVVGHDYGFVAGFIGSFTLTDNKFNFSNGTQQMLTNATDWTVYTNAFGGNEGIVTLATAGNWSKPSPINQSADWIWTNHGYDTNVNRYFSIPITVTPVPIPSAMLLFAPGLAGLAAIKRRFTK
jgi:hypothetical protein